MIFQGARHAVFAHQDSRFILYSAKHLVHASKFCVCVSHMSVGTFSPTHYTKKPWPTLTLIRNRLIELPEHPARMSRAVKVASSAAGLDCVPCKGWENLVIWGKEQGGSDQSDVQGSELIPIAHVTSMDERGTLLVPTFQGAIDSHLIDRFPLDPTMQWFL